MIDALNLVSRAIASAQFPPEVHTGLNDSGQVHTVYEGCLGRLITICKEPIISSIRIQIKPSSSVVHRMVANTLLLTILLAATFHPSRQQAVTSASKTTIVDVAPAVDSLNGNDDLDPKGAS